MSTWIVTGGAGFIGCNFTRLALRETDARIVVFDKLTYAGNRESLRDLEDHPRFVFQRGDIADPAALELLFRRYTPERLINFAAESHVDRSIDGPAAFVQTNVLGTLQLLEAARAALSTRPSSERASFRFLQISTDEVFGSLGPQGAFREDTAFAPRSPYSASKAGADHLVQAYHATYGLPTLRTHCSNNYGPYQFPEKLIPLMILNALEGSPLPLYGDGRHVRDWLYVEDHCRALLRVLEGAAPGSVYTIGGHSERSNRSLVDALCRQLDRLRPISDNPALSGRGMQSYAELTTFVPDRPGHDRRYAIDDHRIRQELGWSPQVELDEGLALTIEWYLAHPGWCAAVQAGSYHRERLGRQGAARTA